jgi:hypothetical protein
MWSGSAQVRLVFSAGVENANSFSASAARSFGQILAQYTTSPLTPPFHLAKRLVLCDSRDRTIWLTKRPALGSRCAPLFQLRLNRERDGLLTNGDNQSPLSPAGRRTGRHSRGRGKSSIGRHVDARVWFTGASADARATDAAAGNPQRQQHFTNHNHGGAGSRAYWRSRIFWPALRRRLHTSLLRTRLGETMRITFRNNLPDRPSNLHLHGMSVSPQGNSDNVFRPPAAKARARSGITPTLTASSTIRSLVECRAVLLSMASSRSFH